MDINYDCQALHSHLQRLGQDEGYDAYLFICNTTRKVDLIDDLLKNLNNHIKDLWGFVEADFFIAYFKSISFILEESADFDWMAVRFNGLSFENSSLAVDN